MDIVLLGAGGAVGRHTSEQLVARGHRIRTVPRHALRDPEALTRAATGAGAIINCAGASVAFELGKGWRGYRAVDTPIGLAAVAAARNTGARLVYVAAHHPAPLAGCAYVDGHERVAAAMADLDGAVVRATGFFSAFAGLVPLARRGVLVDIGSGAARTNPIDERDLAAIIAEAAVTPGARTISAGGPEVLTRRQIFELVAETVTAASHRRVRIFRVPAWLARIGNPLVRIAHPRIGQFAQFATLLADNDSIAATAGTRRLSDYLVALNRAAA